jgi:hypothetical protein
VVVSVDKDLDNLVRRDVDKVSDGVNLWCLKVLHESNVLVGSIVSVLKDSGQVKHRSRGVLPDEISSVKDDDLTCRASAVGNFNLLGIKRVDGECRYVLN